MCGEVWGAGGTVWRAGPGPVVACPPNAPVVQVRGSYQRQAQLQPLPLHAVAPGRLDCLSRLLCLLRRAVRNRYNAVDPARHIHAPSESGFSRRSSPSSP